MGTSMGAQVVAEPAPAHPDLVSQAVLMATRGRSDVMRAAMSLTEKELLDPGIAPPPRQEAVDRAFYGYLERPHVVNTAVLEFFAAGHR
jgi:pimeloyl-ACP methyl ester carboxylesterase